MSELKPLDIEMLENDINAATIGEFLKRLLLRLWQEGECFSGKRPFGNGDWQYQVYAALINAGYEVGELDEDGYVSEVDYTKADKIIDDAITAVFDAPESLRPKGEWIGGYTCSVCPFDVRDLTDGENDLEQWVWNEGFNFCPNCGADMRQTEDTK